MIAEFTYIAKPTSVYYVDFNYSLITDAKFLVRRSTPKMPTKAILQGCFE